jgi:hypothetical protein
MQLYTNPYDPVDQAQPEGTVPQTTAYAQQEQPKPVIKQQQAPKPAPTPPPQGAPPPAGGGLVDRWNEFIDHPENRAGMMQFAVNMLSGKGFGESLGAAAEATGRNVTAQQEYEKAEAQQEVKEREAGAYEMTARAHMIQAQRGDPTDRYYSRLEARDAAAAEREGFNKFRDWVGSGDTLDPRWDYIRKKYPTIKSKDELINPTTPQAKAARDEIAAQFMRPGWQAGGGAGAPAPARRGPPQVGPGQEVRYDKYGNAIVYDKKTKQPVPGQI